MTLWGWIISHRYSWMAVYVLCCNAQTNLIVVFMSCICIVIHSLFVNCPAVIRLPSMLFFFHGEDTTSELWTPIHSFTIDYNLLQTLFSLFTANKHHLPHYTFNPLFQQDRWDWQPHCTVGAKYIGCVCAGSMLLWHQQCHNQRQLLQPQKWFLFSTGSITLVSYWGKTYCLAQFTLHLGFPTGPLRAITL